MPELRFIASSKWIAQISGSRRILATLTPFVAIPFPQLRHSRLEQNSPGASLIFWIAFSTMTSAAALAASVACPGISSPVTAPGSVRGYRASICALSSRRSLQWRAQSQSDKAPTGSPKTEDKNEPTPSWAKPGTEELPPWARNEAAAPVNSSGDLPFPVYLLGSCLVAIAAVGSIFEYFNRNPVFGVVQSDSPLWAPILGVFVIAGFPLAGFLFFKAISLANRASEEADRADGFDP